MRKVLLVDDDHICLELLGNLLLECAGIAPYCAMNGKEALKEMEEEEFDLIITDFNMPGMTGIELAKQVQVIAPNTPIILNSGALSPEIAQQARDCGIAGVIEKPFKLDIMLSLIDSILSNNLLSAVIMSDPGTAQI